MISDALKDMLTSLPNLTNLVSDRISPVSFREEEVFPGLTFNTSNVFPLACRDSSGSYTGILEIGILAENSRGLQELLEIIHGLHDYEGVHEGYALYLSLSNAEFEQKEEKLWANYKAVQFDFTATKLD